MKYRCIGRGQIGSSSEEGRRGSICGKVGLRRAALVVGGIGEKTVRVQLWGEQGKQAKSVRQGEGAVEECRRGGMWEWL